MWSKIYLVTGLALTVGFIWFTVTGRVPFGSSKYETAKAARSRYEPSHSRGFFFGGGSK